MAGVDAHACVTQEEHNYSDVFSCSVPRRSCARAVEARLCTYTRLWGIVVCVWFVCECATFTDTKCEMKPRGVHAAAAAAATRKSVI